MPEGDTIYEAAERLRPALLGATVVRFEAPTLRGVRPWPKVAVQGVEAQGKHLLVHFTGGLSLRTHLRMAGAWHVYRVGEPWRRPAHLARVVIEVDTGWVAVCFSAPTVETYPRATGTPALDDLGPDLCRPDSLDPEVIDAVLARLEALSTPDTQVADALLDQRIAAGIGNVFKSEACFAVGLDPFTPLALVGVDERRRLWEAAARQLRANLTPGRRQTHPRGLAVYRRGGRPCHVCSTPIRMARQGPHQRLTYWCPRCQAPRAR